MEKAWSPTLLSPPSTCLLPKVKAKLVLFLEARAGVDWHRAAGGCWLQRAALGHAAAPLGAANSAACCPGKYAVVGEESECHVGLDWGFLFCIYLRKKKKAHKTPLASY